MKKILLLNIILSLLPLSCNKDEFQIDKDNLLIGTWNLSRYDVNEKIYSRSRTFSYTYCYQFNADGTLIERSLAGFCATPPVSYSDYQGNWSIINDSLIKVKVAYWGGTINYRLKIVSVTVDSLKVTQLPA
ncbi:MAG: lipocalin family protein [Bacteroidota bacterium]|nr:lipocalin family protein [Bacteroidota bacterium]